MINKTYDYSNGNFTQIPNNIINSNISYDSKIVLIYCLSKPDSWNFYMDDLIKQIGMSEKKLQSAIKELEKLGYIKREKQRKGKVWSGWLWTINDVPNQESLDNKELCLQDSYGQSSSWRVDNMESREMGYYSNTNHQVILKPSNDLKDNSQGGADAPTVLLGSSSIGKEMINLYFSTYKIRFGKEHTKLSKGRENTIIKYISMISSTFGIEMENWENMIKYYMYKSKFSIDVDYNINHFTSYGMLNVYLEREFKTPILDPTYSI